ncbi:TRAP transporter small permease [Xanthobacteraceae bacterium Astr-EGSB]|nr:TRAP transporter small permease [Xanthobacteraceae bacterium Astr-EGSB]
MSGTTDDVREKDFRLPMLIGMPAFEHRFFQVLEIVLVALLAGMLVMVFGNVVLRWLSDTALVFDIKPPLPGGILISEEMSRFFFVWLTFIGAVVVMREGAHLGVDALVKVFGPAGRIVLMVSSDLIVLGCCALFFWGTWRQSGVNASNYAPVSGLNMLWVFGVGFFTSVGIGLIVTLRIVRAITGHLLPHELEIFARETDSAAAPKGISE